MRMMPRAMPASVSMRIAYAGGACGASVSVRSHFEHSYAV